MSSIPVANFASCLGKYDTTIQGSVVSDSADYAGTGDISFNGGYILNTTAFVLPAPVTGNGISFSGWFYPTGVETANTALFDVSCTPVATTSQIAVYFTGTNAMSMTYNGTSASTSSNVYSINAWNFFMYTVCCSGNIAIQNLYVNTIGTGANPATLTNSAGTYTQYTVNSTFLGFGAGSTFGVTKYMGKMDDFRFYSRVITPMEYRVLQGSNYGNTAMIALTPSTGTITAIAGNTTSIPFLISNSGTYSFLQYKRIKNNDNSTVVSGNVSTAIMSVSGGYYLWTDTNVSIGTSYLYTWTPCVLGTSGPSTSLTVATFSIASPFTNFIVSNILAGNTGFTLKWTGGIGTSVTYSCYINNVLVSPATGSLSNGTVGVTFTGLTVPTVSTTPTPFAWYVDICANNIGTVHGITTIYCPPTPIVLSSSYNAGYISLALVSGGLCNSNSALTWSYTFTSGVGVTSSQTGLATFPVSPIGVIGTGSWTITVSANNICNGTTVGTVSGTVSSFAIPFSGLIISNILTGNTGFTLNWTGGTGTSVTYGCYINNVLVSPATGSLSNGTTGVTFTGLTAPTSGTTPTPYAWYIDICANITGTTGTIHGINTFYCPPTPLTITNSYTTNNIALTLASGGLCNASSSSLTWAYQFTGGTSGTMSQTGLASFPSSLSVSGNGPWTIIVYANNVVTGTTVGTVNTSVFSSPFSGFIISNILAGNTGFTLNWTGGTGTSGTYSCYINNVLVTPASGSLSNGTTGVTFTGLTAPTSGTTPTPYAWYIDICGANIPGTTATIHGITTIYCPPTPFTMTSSYSSNTISLTLASGGLCNASSSLTWGYQFTSGTSGTMSQTGLGSFPTSLGVTGSGPWSIIVTATNICTGTIIGYVSSSVAAALPVAASLPTAITGMSYGTQTANGFTVSWSGGSGATSYSYAVTYTATGVTSSFTGWTASNYTSSPVVFTNMTQPTAGTYNITVTATNSTGSVSNTLTGCLVKPRYIFAFNNGCYNTGIGGTSMIGYSADGYTWTGVDSPNYFANVTGINCVATSGSYGGTGYIMACATSQPYLIRATNGKSASDWTQLNGFYNLSSNYGSLNGIAFGNGKWVAGGNSQMIGPAYSVNDGVTWTYCTLPSGYPISVNSVAFGNGYFMIVGMTNGYTGSTTGVGMYSTDGITFSLTNPNSYSIGWRYCQNCAKVKWLSGNTFLHLVSSSQQGGWVLWVTNAFQNSQGGGINSWYGYSSTTLNIYGATTNITDMVYDPYTDTVQYNFLGGSTIVAMITQNALINTNASQGFNSNGMYTLTGIPSTSNTAGNINMANVLYGTMNTVTNYTVCASAILPGMYVAVGSCRSTGGTTATTGGFGSANIVRGFYNGLNNYTHEQQCYNPCPSSFAVFPSQNNGLLYNSCAIVY